ncbi:HlyD family secretion protein [Aureimonas leprariae]|uniref:HlyD family secretion protein n=1 Tax=Plantimonas leprariae TaxID=2615207 RepID=A0A7V7PQR4_9HYPH|nr:HlyD family secretion protein [Aureimonas leprariae]KAB0680751.1 HlyD family secretion protein [Aureimonas leprariae]
MPDDQRAPTIDAEEGQRHDAPAGRSLDDWQKDAERKAKRGGQEDEQAPKRSEGSAENESDDAADEGGDEQPAPKKPSLIRRHPLWILFGLIGVAVVAVLGYFTWLIFFYPYESTDDAFVDARQFSVAAKVSGYVGEVPVTDNQHVNPGDVILSIDPRDYQIALDQAKGQLESAKAFVQSADAQIASSNAAVDQSKARIASAQAALQFAQDEASRQQKLAQTGTGTVQNAQQAVSNLQQSQASFQEAQAGLTSSVKSVASAQAQKASAIASLHQAEASVEQAEQNLGYTTIKAEQAGRVVRLTGSKGQYLDAGQSVSMFVPDEIWVTANFKETQITDMRPGQPVDVSIDAYPDHPLQGRIDSVQPGSGTAFSLLPAENATGNYVKVVQRVPVKIVVDKWPTDVSIGPGMSVVPSATVRQPPAYIRPYADRLRN